MITQSPCCRVTSTGFGYSRPHSLRHSSCSNETNREASVTKTLGSRRSRPGFLGYAMSCRSRSSKSDPTLWRVVAHSRWQRSVPARCPRAILVRFARNIAKNGAPEGIRTHDPQIRSLRYVGDFREGSMSYIGRVLLGYLVLHRNRATRFHCRSRCCED